MFYKRGNYNLNEELFDYLILFIPYTDHHRFNISTFYSIE